MVRRLALTAIVLASACTFPEAPLPPGVREVVVHAVFDASRLNQRVSVRLTDGAQQVPALTDADVTLTLPDHTVLAAVRGPDVQLSDQAYVFDFEGAGRTVVPGETYHLRVATASGDTVTGTTTVPAASLPEWIQGFSLRREVDTLRLAWARVPGARSYEVQVVTSFRRGDRTYTELRYRAFTDTAITLSGTARNFANAELFTAGLTTRVYVYAVDDNYYEYYRVLGDPYVGAAPSRLEGGLGVFGSIAPIALYSLDVR